MSLEVAFSVSQRYFNLDILVHICGTDVTFISSYIFVELNTPMSPIIVFNCSCHKLSFPPTSVGRWADAISCIPFLKSKNSRGKSSRGLGNPLYEGEELTKSSIIFPRLMKNSLFKRFNASLLICCDLTMLLCRNTLRRLLGRPPGE